MRANKVVQTNEGSILIRRGQICDLCILQNTDTLSSRIVGRDRLLWNSMVQGTQGFRQVRAVRCVIPYVRPGAAGLLTDIECSRIRDSSWMHLTSFLTTRIGV